MPDWNTGLLPAGQPLGGDPRGVTLHQPPLSRASAPAPRPHPPGCPSPPICSSKDRRNAKGQRIALPGHVPGGHQVLTVLAMNSGGLSLTSVTAMMAVAVFERP